MESYRVEYVKFERNVGITKFVENMSKENLIKLLENDMITVRYAKKLRT